MSSKEWIMIDKEEITSILRDQFSAELPKEWVFYTSNNKRIWVTLRDMKKDRELNFGFKQIRFGLYFGSFDLGGFRLSIEGAQILQKYAKKNILNINEEQKNEWSRGKDLLPLDNYFVSNQFVLIKYENQIIGTGFFSKNRIKNFLPKIRRLDN